MAFLLFFPMAYLQHQIDPQRHQFEPVQRGKNEILSKLPIEFALAGLVGFREAAAGLLWVRTDEFFHNGDYEAITPMIRLITWLDPHQIDVYETGAWHMDYNFTDTDQRSDRRYIPLSIALMKEGIANNDDVPDMYADLAFTHYYRKINDFEQSAIWFRKGQEELDLLRSEHQPIGIGLDQEDAGKQLSYSVTTTSHGLAHSLEAIGDIPGAEKQWQYVIQAHQRNMVEYPKMAYSETVALQTAQKQLYEMQQRAVWRPRDTKIPWNVHFSAKVTRVAPKVILITGTLDSQGATQFDLKTGKVQWGNIDGCRIGIRLQDAGYKMKEIKDFNLNSIQLNPNTTIMQDSVAVRDGKFQRKIDMSKDPDIYSFSAPQYTITVWFDPSNPLNCPINVQDRIGWHGEGMTDDKYLNTTGWIPGDTVQPIPGLRTVQKTFALSKEDLLGTDTAVFEK